MLSRLVKVLMLSAAIAAGGPIALLDAGAASAAAQTAPVKLTAAQMLNRQRLAVSVMSKTYAALPKQARGKSTPFLKGLIDLANAYKEVDAASKARNSRKMGAALPKVATAIAKLNSAYQLSGMTDPQLSASIKSLNMLWKDYLKVAGVTAPKKASPKQMMVGARKIDKMRHELMRQSSHNGDRRAAVQRAHMLALLKQADEANRRADEAWYASILMAEILGYYAGSYEYYTVYEPSYAVNYRQSWQVISVETTYFYSESVTYYEEYRWTSYEQTVDVSESYDFGLSQTEVTTVESQIEQNNVAVDQGAVTLYETADDRKALETVETDIQVDESAVDSAPASDVAPASDTVPPVTPDTAPPATPDTVTPGQEQATPDAGQPTDQVAPPAPDAVAPGTDDAQPQPDAVAPGTEDTQSPDPAAPSDVDNGGVDDACAGDNPPESCFAVEPDQSAPQDGEQQMDSQPSDQPQEDAAPQGEQQMDAQPEPQQEEAAPQDEQQIDSQPEEQLQEEAAPQQDESSDNGGDVCAGANPPADCFPAQQEEAAPQEEEAAPQEDAAPQEEEAAPQEEEAAPQEEEAAPQEEEEAPAEEAPVEEAPADDGSDG